MTKSAKKGLKITAFVLLGIIGALIVTVGAYLLYVVCQYSRIEDHQKLAVENAKTATLTTDTPYRVMTYNIGFGAYSQDFSFFLDSGEMLDGTKISGTGSRAKDKETVMTNTNGALDAAVDAACDFYLFQEVDIDATRSHHIDQSALLIDGLGDAYSHTFAYNFRSAYLFYPILSPHGKTDAGLLTLSKYQISASERRSLPVDNGFPTRFFDLDRCFSVNRVPVGERELVLVNMHMSAYDEGGTVRRDQLEMLNGFMAKERDNNNYVVVGGDFNHALMNSVNMFPTEQKVPEWVFELKNDMLTEGFRMAAGTNAPSCRSSDMGYTKGVNYSAVLDGYIVSDNVTVTESKIIDLDFQYSDHNPSVITFTLNA